MVLDVEKKPRKSWVIWGEGEKYPNVIVEILWSTTVETDKRLKKQIYPDIFCTLDYFGFDTETL